jgi:hypothetical protein
VTLFDDVPLPEVINVGVDPHDGSHHKEDRDDVDQEESSGMRPSRDTFLDFDGRWDCHVPEHPEHQSVVVEEGIPSDEGFNLTKEKVNVLHDFNFNITQLDPLDFHVLYGQLPHFEAAVSDESS